MVSRDNTNTLRKTTHSNQHTVSEPIPPRNFQNREQTINDDVIMSLANAYENKRARQVSEWEHMRRFMRHAA